MCARWTPARADPRRSRHLHARLAAGWPVPAGARPIKKRSCTSTAVSIRLSDCRTPAVASPLPLATARPALLHCSAGLAAGLGSGRGVSPSGTASSLISRRNRAGVTWGRWCCSGRRQPRAGAQPCTSRPSTRRAGRRTRSGDAARRDRAGRRRAVLAPAWAADPAHPAGAAGSPVLLCWERLVGALTASASRASRLRASADHPPPRPAGVRRRPAAHGRLGALVGQGPCARSVRDLHRRVCSPPPASALSTAVVVLFCGPLARGAVPALPPGLLRRTSAPAVLWLLAPRPGRSRPWRLPWRRGARNLSATSALLRVSCTPPAEHFAQLGTEQPGALAQRLLGGRRCPAR